MGAQLKDEITNDLDDIKREWPDVYNQTKATVSAMKNYYTKAYNESEIAQRTEADSKNLKKDLDKHADLAARGSSAKRDLKTQVDSSENRVQKMNKYGRPAAVSFSFLGALIGGDIGGKIPGVGGIVSIVVGRLLGLIVLGLIALVIYLIVEWRFRKRRSMWKECENSNQDSLELVALINKKKSSLSEVRNLLNDIEPDNMASGRPALLEGMTEYLKQEPIRQYGLNQV